MVDTTGHLAMGLLFALPAWFLWTERVSLAFVGFAVLAAQAPDVDVYLAAVAPSAFHHHGVTHTVVFVLAVSLVGGALAAVALTRPIDDWIDADRFDWKSTFGFAAGAFLVGGLSHIFADVLSAPDVSTPLEPLWPFLDRPVALDLIWYDSPLWNVGLLILAVFLHALLAYFADTVDHPSRVTGA